MKKLYRVEIVTTLYVLAENEGDAEALGFRHARDEDPESQMVYEVTHPKDIDPAWRGSLPYGSEDDKTCLEILADIPEGTPVQKPEDPNQQKLFP